MLSATFSFPNKALTFSKRFAGAGWWWRILGQLFFLVKQNEGSAGQHGIVEIHTIGKIHTGVLSLPFIPSTPSLKSFVLKSHLFTAPFLSFLREVGRLSRLRLFLSHSFRAEAHCVWKRPTHTQERGWLPVKCLLMQSLIEFLDVQCRLCWERFVVLKESAPPEDIARSDMIAQHVSSSNLLSGKTSHMTSL